MYFFYLSKGLAVNMMSALSACTPLSSPSYYLLIKPQLCHRCQSEWVTAEHPELPRCRWAVKSSESVSNGPPSAAKTNRAMSVEPVAPVKNFEGIRWMTEGGGGHEMMLWLNRAKRMHMSTQRHVTLFTYIVGNCNSCICLFCWRRRLKNTCSKPSLLLPFGQMAVGVELGVGARRRACGFGPTFPLDEVGDPTLSQRGGLRHVVPHSLRDACVTERDRSHIWSHEFKNMKIINK